MRIPPLGTTKNVTGWIVIEIGTGKTRSPVTEPWIHRQAVLAMQREQGRLE